jgi:hypothetical protein
MTNNEEPAENLTDFAIALMLTRIFLGGEDKEAARNLLEIAYLHKHSGWYQLRIKRKRSG